MLPIRDASPSGVWWRKQQRRARRKTARLVRKTIILTGVLSVVMPMLILALCEYFGVWFAARL